MHKNEYFIKFLIVLSITLAFITNITAQNNQDYETPENLAAENGEFISIDGETLYFETAGNKSAPAVILIHGFGGSTQSWRMNMQAIAEAGFYAIALDMPPFGLSAKSPELDYTRSAMADRVAAFMDALEIETATIAGHSMGGSVTAYFAVNHPEKVDKLVFISGGIFELADVGDRAESDEITPGSLLGNLSVLDPESPLTATLVSTLLTEDLFKQLLQSAYYNSEMVTDEIVALYYRPTALENWVAGFIAYSTAQESNPLDVVTLATAVEGVPVMIIWGQEDTWVDIAVGEGMNAAFESEFVVYPEIGHLVMEEIPDQFNADFIAFLQE